MTVRPVDMITMLPRLNEVGKVQHQAEHQPLIHGQIQAVRQQERAEHAQSQVNKKANSDQVALQKDGRGQQPAQQHAGKRDQHAKANDGKENPPESGTGHRLDVKV